MPDCKHREGTCAEQEIITTNHVSQVKVRAPWSISETLKSHNDDQGPKNKFYNSYLNSSIWSIIHILFRALKGTDT